MSRRAARLSTVLATLTAIAALVGPAPARAADTRPQPQVIPGGGGEVYSVVVFDGGKRIASAGGRSGVVRVFDTATGKEVQTIDGHTDRVNCVALSHDGTRLATASYDDTARVWDAQTLKLIKAFKLPSNGFTVGFSADDKAILVSGNTNFTRLIEIDSGAGAKDDWKSGYISAFAPQGRAFVTTKDVIRMWNGVREQRWSVPKPKGSTHHLTFTPDGQILLVPAHEAGVLVLDAKDGKELRRLPVHGEGAYGLAVSTDSKWALIGTSAGRVYQVEIATGREMQKWEGHTRDVSSIALWPDGSMFATGSTDGTVRTWRIDSTEAAQLKPGVATAIPGVGVTPGQTASSTGTGPTPPGSNLNLPSTGKPATGTSAGGSTPAANAGSTPATPTTPPKPPVKPTQPPTAVAVTPEPTPAELTAPLPPQPAADPIERPEFRDKPKPLAKSLTSVTAMMVRVADDGSATGMTSDVIATVPADTRRGHAGEGRGAARFVRHSGEHMEISLEEAVRAVKIRYPHWGPGEIAVSFGEKYKEHDGGSAGTAFGVLMLSVLEGIDLDPKCALTGDITVDWKVRKVGAVAAKLRGATVDGCTYAGIPAENANALSDMTLLWGDSSLWDVQTLTLATLQDAVNLARVDRPQALAEALRLFAGLQPRLAKQGRGALRDANVQGALRRILALAPNHLSAKLLLAIAENKPPQALSAGASLYEISVICYPYRNILGQREQVSRRNLPVAITANARKRIAHLRPVVSKDLVPVLNDLAAFVEKAEAVAAGQGKQQDVAERREAFFQHLSGLSEDREVLEKLVREGY